MHQIIIWLLLHLKKGKIKIVVILKRITLFSYLFQRWIRKLYSRISKQDLYTDLPTGGYQVLWWFNQIFLLHWIWIKLRCIVSCLHVRLSSYSTTQNDIFRGEDKSYFVGYRFEINNMQCISYTLTYIQWMHSVLLRRRGFIL